MENDPQAASPRRSRWPFRSLGWTASAVACLGLFRWLPSSFWDRVYYQGVFGWWRTLYDTVLGWSPVPFIYLILAVILVRFARWWGERERGWSWIALRAMGGIGALVTLFYLCWGFNYRQVPIQHRLGYDLTTFTLPEIDAEFHRATEALAAEAATLPPRLIADDAILHEPVSDGQLRPDVVASLLELGLPHAGKVRVRQLWPKGLLLRWSTAGVYIPQASEGHIDPGLAAVQKPFTMAHEMAHGYGITDEGACNFIAWLACTRSRDPWIRYSGLLSYWRYAAAEMPRDTVAAVLDRLPPVVRRSIVLIKENDQKYPDFLPRFRDLVYGTYLRRHGVHAGLRSYNYVVMMVSRHLARQAASTGEGPE